MSRLRRRLSGRGRRWIGDALAFGRVGGAADQDSCRARVYALMPCGIAPCGHFVECYATTEVSRASQGAINGQVHPTILGDRLLCDRRSPLCAP